MAFRVGAFLVADTVAEDERGRAVIRGVLTAVEANTVRTVSVYAEFFSAEGAPEQVHVSVRLVGPDGATSIVSHDTPVTFRPEEATVAVVLRGRLETRKRGLHELQLLVGDRVVGDRPLMAVDRVA